MTRCSEDPAYLPSLARQESLLLAYLKKGHRYIPSPKFKPIALYGCAYMLKSLHAGSADFVFKIIQIILSGISSVCQIVWIQIRPDILSGLIWFQTVCKGYQHTTKVSTSKSELFFCAVALYPNQHFSVISGHTPVFLG